MSHDHQEIDLSLIAGVTDRGLRHRQNEDAMELAVVPAAAGPVLVAVVCDGVSTSIRPDEASLAAARAAAAVLRTAAQDGTD
ncbi:MAG: PP2C family protein-serine/threonine phosphatase, partial [Streptosporangiaceae bacterium]